MPAQSRKQQRYLYAHFGSDWVHAHHFDELAKGAKKKPKRKKKSGY